MENTTWKTHVVTFSWYCVSHHHACSFTVPVCLAVTLSVRVGILICLPILFRVIPYIFQSHDCPSTNEISLSYTGDINQYQASSTATKAKRVHCVFIFYFMSHRNFLTNGTICYIFNAITCLISYRDCLVLTARHRLDIPGILFILYGKYYASEYWRTHLLAMYYDVSHHSSEL